MKKTSFKPIRVFLFIVLFMVLYRLTFQICVVNGISMNNTFHNDQMLVQLRFKDANYGDIVSIYSSTLDELLCKRVIALEGDEVVIRGKEVYVNGTLRDEPYAYYDTEPVAEYSFTVDDDCVFVMGDNRNHSTDSRQLGSINKENIKSVYLFNLSNILHADYSTIQSVLKVAWVSLFTVWFISGIKYKKKVEEDNEQIEVNGESK